MAQALMVLPNQTPDIEIKSFELLETEQNWRSLELVGPRAEIYKSKSLVGIEAPHATIWNKAGNQTLVRGDSGIIDSKNGNVQVVGSTQIEAQNGMVFSTDSITLQNAEKRISSDSNVVGRSKPIGNQPSSLEISGVGMEVDVKAQAYTILANVQARQNQAAGDFFKIKSNSASIYPVNNRAQFNGQAEVQSKKMLLKGEVALLIMASKTKEAKIEGIEMSSNSDEATVLANIDSFIINSKGFRATFSPSGGLVESRAIGSVNAVSPSGVKMNAQKLILVPGANGFVVNLEQGVKITIDDRIATCEEAVYYPSSGNIILKKFASVIKQDQELNGDLIRLSTKNSEITVEKASGTLSRESLKKKSNK